MTSIPDNSVNGHDLIINGNSKMSEGIQEKSVVHKASIKPTTVGFLTSADNFGSIMDIFEDVLVVGSPTVNQLSGAVWVFEKTSKQRIRKSQKVSRERQTFTHTGSKQTWTAPENVKNVTIQLVGAGGGGNALGTHLGGNGAYVKAVIAVDPGKTYDIIVGQGGVAAGTTRPFGGGGRVPENSIGGSGGGRSAIADPVFGDMLTAGGGGGAGKDGPGGFAGVKAGDGVALKADGSAIVPAVNAIGANEYLTGFNASALTTNYLVDGLWTLTNNIMDPATGVEKPNYLNTKYQGEDAKAALSLLGKTVNESGAGGGGFAGGAAGPESYGERFRTTVGNIFPTGGSGSGGSSMADPTLAFPFRNTEDMIRDVVVFDGNARQLPVEFDAFGHGGDDTTPGQDGTIVIEWDVYAEGDDETTEDLQDWKETHFYTFNPVDAGGINYSCRVGAAVATNGEYIAIGSPYDLANSDGNLFAPPQIGGNGTLTILKKENGAWVRTQRIIATGTNGRTDNLFGASVKFIGGKLFVGAPTSDTDSTGANAVTDAGEVFVFELVNDAWVQTGRISATGTNSRIASDSFGYKLAGFGDTLMVASKNSYDALGANLVAGAGSVFVYNVDTLAQVQRIAGPRIANAGFGSSMSVKAGTMVIGAEGTAETYVYKLENTTWVQETKKSHAASHLISYCPMLVTGNTVAQSVNGLNFTYESHTMSEGISGGTLGDIYQFYFGNTQRGRSRSNNNMGFTQNYGRRGGFRASVPAILSRTEFTLSKWLYILQPQTFTGFENAGTPMPLFRRGSLWGVFLERSSGEANGGNLYLQVANSGNPKRFHFGKLPKDRWIHMAITLKGTKLRLFVNGELRNTYDIASVSLADDPSIPISWGYNPAIDALEAPLYGMGDFALYDIARYDQSYTPSDTSYFETHWNEIPKDPSTFGRGKAAFVVDENTILEGLPTSYSDEAVHHNPRTRHQNSTVHHEDIMMNSGKVEITQFDGEEWTTEKSLPIITPGHAYIRPNYGTQFGKNVHIDKDHLYVYAMDSMEHASNWSPSLGAVWTFDVQNDFKLIEKVLSPARKDAAMGDLKVENVDKMSIVDRSATVRNELYFGFETMALINNGDNHVPYAFKKLYYADRQQRRTDIEVDSSGLPFSTASYYYQTITSAEMKTQQISSLNAPFATFNSIASPMPAAKVFERNLVSDSSGKTYVMQPNERSTFGPYTKSFPGKVSELQYQINGSYNFVETFAMPGSEGANTGYDTFGLTVKVVNDTVWIGSSQSLHTQYNWNSGYYFGKIYSYKYFKERAGWDIDRTLQNIPSATPATHPMFGSSFDIKGDFLLARSRGAANTTAYLYKINEDSFELVQQVTVGTDSDDNKFAGSAVAFFGDSMESVIGSPWTHTPSRNYVGRVDHYGWDETAGQLVPDSVLYRPTMLVDDREYVTSLGSAAVLSNGRLFVGADYYSKDEAFNLTRGGNGAVYYYDKNADGYWEQKGIMSNYVGNTGLRMGARIHVMGDSVLMHGNYPSNNRVDLMKHDAVTDTYAFVKSFTSSPNKYPASGAFVSENHIVIGQIYTTAQVNQTGPMTGSWVEYKGADATWTVGSDHYVPMITNGAYDYGVIDYTSFANTIYGRATDERFGTDVKLSADKSMLLVGAPSNYYNANHVSKNPVGNLGAVVAFYWDETNTKWRLNTKIHDTNSETQGTQFGQKITRSGNDFIVTSYGTTLEGIITTLSYDVSGVNAKWTQKFQLKNNVGYTYFGSGVAYDSVRDLYVVGTEMGSVDSMQSGLFETITSTKTRQSYSIAGSVNNRVAGMAFGYSVATYDGKMAVGAPYYPYSNNGTTPAGPGGGLVYTYELTPNNTFKPVQKITFENQATNHFGLQLGISNEQMFVTGTSTKPVVLSKDGSGKFVNPVTVNAINSSGQTITPRTVAWDPETKESAFVGLSSNVWNIPLNFGPNGVVVPLNWDGDKYVQDTAFSSASVTATNIVDLPNLALSLNTQFGQHGMAFSPDKTKLAIAAPGDHYSVYKPEPLYANQGTNLLNGKVYVYEWDADKSKFVLHSVIPTPAFGAATSETMRLSWDGDRLTVGISNILYAYEHVEDRLWKVVETTSMESGFVGSITALEGQALLMTRPTSKGYPSVENSGAIRVQLYNDGILGSSRGIRAGANAEVFNNGTDTVGRGGGGAGAIGGKASGYLSIRGKATGGSNLVPAGANEFISNGTTRANAISEHATGAGGNAPGANGENARIVIKAGETTTVFDFNGFDQNYVVPAGVSEIEFTMWGAGGGSASDRDLTEWYQARSGRGGAGACVSGTLAVTAGETLKLIVGGGGSGGKRFAESPSLKKQLKYGLGGIGSLAQNASDNSGGCGGGLAAIARGETYLAIAGGGAGGSMAVAANVRLDGLPGGLLVDQDVSISNSTSSDADHIYAPGITNSRAAGDYFGYKVAIAGDDSILVGAPGHDYDYVGDRLPDNAGAVYAYARTNGKWEITTKINSAVPTTGEFFGLDINVAADKVAVLGGSPKGYGVGYLHEYVDALSSNSLEVFTRTGDSLTSLAKTLITDPVKTGKSVVLDGNDLVLGTPSLRTNGLATPLIQAGGFETYAINAPTMSKVDTQVSAGVSHGRFGGDKFGSSVELIGNQVVIGAPGHDYTTNGEDYRLDQGALFVFEKKGPVYSFRSKINLELESEATGFGKTLKVIGDKLYAGTDDVAHNVELTQTNGNWAISKHIESTAGKIAEIVSQNKLIVLDPTSGAGLNGQPTLAASGIAHTFAIESDGTTTDQNQSYTIPGKSRGRNAGDQFGYSVYAGNDFVVVGAPNHSFDANGLTQDKAGALFVFNKSGDKWNAETKIVPDLAATTGFGRTIAGRNGWIITSGLTLDDGFARVMQRVATGVWETRKDYTGTGIGGDGFGMAVAAADTNKFAIGSPLSDSDFTDTGSVQTYERVGADWFNRNTLQTQGLTKGRNAGDWFGYSVASNKNYVVIGSPKYAYDAVGANELAESGALWIYLKNSKFPMIGKYVSPVRSENGLFGNAVGIDEKSNRIAVGEPGTNSVHVFAFDGETLTLEQTLTVSVGTNEVFGVTLAFNANTIIVGSAKASTDADGANELADAGAAYVFVRDNSNATWSLKEKIAGFAEPNGRQDGDLMGTAVAIDAKGSAIIGAPGHDWDINGANEVADAGAVLIKKVK